MNPRISWLFALLVLQSTMVHAQTQTRGQGNMLEAITITILPILLVAAFVYFFFIRVRKNTDSTAKYIQRNEQHMERVEQTLDRIAAALEKRNTNQG